MLGCMKNLGEILVLKIQTIGTYFGASSIYIYMCISMCICVCVYVCVFYFILL
jgi:hypothetical protein